MTTKNPARPRLTLLTSRRSATARPRPWQWLLILTALLPSSLLAQTNAAKGPLSSNRYLIIVETSRGMQKRTENVFKTVRELLTAGLAGQLRRGDTIGVWTYNEQLHAGVFPLQQWTPETHPTVAAKVMTYLKEQPFEKHARVESMVPVLDKVIKSSGVLTVFLISTGEQPIQGTPFDDEINKFYKTWKHEQLKARMPFVTLLRANKGTVTHHSVTSAPWPVEMPPLPPEPIPVVTTATNPPSKKAPPVVPNLIVSGKKNPPPPKPLETIPTNTAIAVPATTQPGNEVIPVAPAAPSDPVSPLSNQAVLPNPAVALPLASTPDVNPETLTSDVAEKPRPAVAQNDPQPAASPSVPKASADETAIAAKTEPPPADSESAKAKLSGPGNELPSRQAVSSPEVIAIAPQGLFGQKAIIITGLAVAAIVVVLGLLTFRRTKPGSHTSLITRSFDRDSK